MADLWAARHSTGADASGLLRCSVDVLPGHRRNPSVSTTAGHRRAPSGAGLSPPAYKSRGDVRRSLPNDFTGQVGAGLCCLCTNGGCAFSLVQGLFPAWCDLCSHAIP